jgi:hypothetical protein
MSVRVPWLGRKRLQLVFGYRAPWYAHFAIGRDGVREALAPPAAQMLKSGERTPWCNFHDGSPAAVSGRAGAGRIVAIGFLPPWRTSSLRWRPACHSSGKSPPKNWLSSNMPWPGNTSRKRPARPPPACGRISGPVPSRLPTANSWTARTTPWQLPAGVRDLIAWPVREAGITPPLSCDTPLIDAVQLPCEQGPLIALANYTLQPRERLGLQLRVSKPVQRVKSVRHGPLRFDQAPGLIRWTMPLAASDSVMVHAGP